MYRMVRDVAFLLPEIDPLHDVATIRRVIDGEIVRTGDANAAPVLSVTPGVRLAKVFR